MLGPMRSAVKLRLVMSNVEPAIPMRAATKKISYLVMFSSVSQPNRIQPQAVIPEMRYMKLKLGFDYTYNLPIRQPRTNVTFLPTLLLIYFIQVDVANPKRNITNGTVATYELCSCRVIWR